MTNFSFLLSCENIRPHQHIIVRKIKCAVKKKVKRIKGGFCKHGRRKKYRKVCKMFAGLMIGFPEVN